MDPVYIVRCGTKYGYYFNTSYRDRDLSLYLTDDINRARQFSSLPSAKGNATRLRNVLLNQAKHEDPSPYEPIEIIEVKLQIGQIVDQKRSVMEDI